MGKFISLTQYSTKAKLLFNVDQIAAVVDSGQQYERVKNWYGKVIREYKETKYTGLQVGNGSHYYVIEDYETVKALIEAAV